MLYQLDEGKLEVMTDRNAQRLEDCILVLLTGRSEVGSLSAMIMAKAIIEGALEEHSVWKKDPVVIARNKKIDHILRESEAVEDAEG